MKTIPENKIELYLKLGRKLACFVKVYWYFESRTFDWIKLEKSDLNYKATLIRSLDEGDEIFNDVTEFETCNELDKDENDFLEGDIETIKQWMMEKFDLKMDGFHQMNDLKVKYMELVKENKLGSQLNDGHI
ncbi:hypothetical protein [Sinomicrobium pectinilyticum]|uniref:Uncharacterized protein n=1 Tax=Sinomicrobium pectinilyticum TaxID=1084421 RepID=A0A3N0DRM6_SINP1|nr:hypothetical protein [Sinomicrobium pectinilyticum]RNL78003.1 hypothetical protein ED312_20090 [Sinomicrobium pectinilyticum]